MPTVIIFYERATKHQKNKEKARFPKRKLYQEDNGGYSAELRVKRTYLSVRWGLWNHNSVGNLFHLVRLFLLKFIPIHQTTYITTVYTPPNDSQHLKKSAPSLNLVFWSTYIMWLPYRNSNSGLVFVQTFLNEANHVLVSWPCSWIHL